MLSFAKRAFNLQPHTNLLLPFPQNQNLTISKLNFSGDLSTGLRLILDHYIDSCLTNNSSIATVIHKPSTTLIENESEFGNFLNSCQLCKKKLKSGEDVYMYMGDQGFCSVDCRTKQIGIDEMKEIEKALDRRIMESDSNLTECPSGGDCETCRILEDLRSRRRSRRSARR